MPRVTVDDFSKGLFIAPPSDKLPEGALRLARGLDHVATRSARVRKGSDVLVPSVPDPHSIVRYNDMRFQGGGTVLYKSGVSIDTGYNGDRLAFAEMPPTVDLEDYLFVAGGGQLRKVHPDGTTVSKWGIAAPADGFTATKQTRKENQVNSDRTTDLCDATASWVTNEVTLTADATLKQQGTAALKMAVVADTLGQIWRNVTTVDLTVYGDAVVSTEQDFILLWVLVAKPEALEYLQIDFNVDSANWSVVDSIGQSPNTFTIKVNPSDNASEIAGVATLQDEHLFARDNKARTAGANTSDPRLNDDTNRAVVTQIGGTKLSPGGNVWTELRIPKTSFKRKGSGTLGWESVRGVRFSVKTNDTAACNVYVDDLRLGGAVGMQGGYKHHITFKNSVTGHRSNPNPTAVETQKVDRQVIAIAALPTTSTDSQVDTVEVWRTLGDGETFFKAGEVTLGTATFTDDVADYFGLHADEGEYLESLELEFDNDPPEDTYGDCVGPWQGRMWWCRDSTAGAEGRVYYSPEGRPEAVQGYVNVTATDDPTQRIVMWAGHLYVWSVEHVFEIVGSDEPFVYREFDGVPGTDKTFTVVPSPFGIIYTSREGVTVFDGAHSQLLFPDAILPLFHGDTRANLPPFYPVVATVWHDNYYVSDGVRTYTVNTKGVWREFGLGLHSFYVEPDTNLLTAGWNGRILSLEHPGEFTDSSEPVEFGIETPALYTGTGKVGLLQRLFVEADAPTETIVPTLIVDDGTEYILPAMTGPVRGVPWEYALGHTAKYAAVRLESSVSTGDLEVFEISLDIHLGLEDDDKTPFAKIQELLGVRR